MTTVTADRTADRVAEAPRPVTPVLSVRDLVVSYESRRQRSAVVDGVSFDVGRGEVVAIVGESGSGKTTTAQAVIGLLPSNGRIDAGTVLLGDLELTGQRDAVLRTVRGRRIGLVPQDPNNSLNPVATIGSSLAEALRIHGWGSREAVRASVLDLLERVGIDQPELRARQYPHQLSGGMKQRVLIAAAIAMEPELIIADEPTSALDVTVQRVVLDLIDELRQETGASVLLVTHDLGVAQERADRIVVMRDGRVVEQGETHALAGRPQDPYTRTLLAEAAAIAGGGARVRSRTAPEEGIPQREAAIEVVDLVQEFSRGRGQDPFRAVDRVSLRVPSGTTHAIVGESGSGKTSTARAVLGLQRPTSGSVRVAGVDVTALRGRDTRDFSRRAQFVFQNPFSSLDPRQRVADIIAEPLVNHRIGDRRSRREAVADFLDRVALPQSVAGRLPRELSGGQRQRVAIARALILRPDVVVLDEPVSALDVTVQTQILRLLADLQAELSLTYLFISHDLGVVAHLSDTVSVMRAGRVVEAGPTHAIFTTPTSEYTSELLAAIPGR
ncbi:dipeptide ABC transporter ATP-binding protein [Tessaracoccus sp. G1721]